LAEWRGRIDAADRELVALLNRRAEYVLKLAPLKRQIGAAVRDPGREEEVLRKLRKANRGPLPNEALEKIYGSIMGAMRDLQSPE
jgi:chorismate mutase/prephenate dehydratase